MSMISSVFDDSEPHRKLFIIENKSMMGEKKENSKMKQIFQFCLFISSSFLNTIMDRKNDTAKE